jgi:hypothetical protein
VSLASNGCQTTSNFTRWCDVHHSLHRNHQNINFDRPRCRGVSITPWRETGRQLSECECRLQTVGRKGGRPRATRGGPTEQATMANANEGVMRRCQGEPAYAGYLFTRQEACPKGIGFSAWFANRSQAALDTEPGVKHRPNVAQSRYTTVPCPLLPTHPLGQIPPPTQERCVSLTGAHDNHVSG